VEATSIKTNESGPALSQLNRLLAPQAERLPDSLPGDIETSWLTAGTWRVFARPRLTRPPAGDEIERFLLPTGNAVAAVFDSGQGRAWVPFDLDEAYRNYLTESWRTEMRSRALTDAQLRAYYAAKRMIPRRLQIAARRLYTKWLGFPEFPSWPLDDSVVLLLRFYASCLLLGTDAATLRFRWFWPDDFHAAMILTHDVESAEGLRLALELADLEEERGFRSSFNVVASSYHIDHGVLRELRGRGFEIGLHGLRHDRSLFSSRKAFEGQLPGIADAVRAFDAQGFRSPSTHRVHEWLQELPVRYDCSVPHSDPFEPMPGGCCTLWPYFIGEVVELPYTLPQDHTLFTVLRRKSTGPWLAQVEAIERRYGLVQCLSHPDSGYLGDPDNRALYTEFLDALVERPRLWKPLPRDLDAWWRRRDAGAPGEGFSFGVIRRGEDGPYATLEPPP
jgi:peptidoglycan/xylan/chitin deacetylase (PgdA/CDA1 family)